MNTDNKLILATKLLEKKQFQKAEKLLKSLISDSTKHAELHELLGVSYLLQGQNQQAKKWLSSALKIEPNDARYANNLGEAHRKLKKYKSAKKYFNHALKLQNNYNSARFNLACTLLAQKKYKKALKLLKYLLNRDSQNADYQSALADLLRETNNIKQAIGHYHKAIEINTQHVASHRNLGPLLLSTGSIDNALKHCRLAVELAPYNGLSHLNLGRCLSNLEQYDEAMDAYADAMELIPDSPLLLTEIGKNWLLTNDLIQAEYWFMQALKKDANHIPASTMLADTHREGGLLNEALVELDELLEKHPKAPQAYQIRAKTHLDNGNIKACLNDYKQLIKLKPNHAQLHSSYGHALQNAGNLKAAEQQFRLALSKNPRCVPALNGLATTQKGKLPKVDADKIQSLIFHEELRDGAISSLHSALGYYHDGTKNYKKAANHIDLANKHYWKAKTQTGWSYEPDNYKARVDAIIKTFDSDYFSKLKLIGNPSKIPTFILGMPRSGTTLTEQILNAHPQILGVGERSFASESFADLPNIFNQSNMSSLELVPHVNQQLVDELSAWYLDKLLGLQEKSGKNTVSRIVDKMPDNYSQIGWILTLFPNAKIIHAKRDVRDIAVSCWMTQFGKIKWAFNLDHLAERIIQYDRLMKHWRKIIPDRFIETNYEDMIADQTHHSKRIIRYLDLPWDDNCLQFHRQDSVVRTASVTQVRQPIYTKSLQRWKRYETPLAKLFSRIEKAGVDLYK